MSNLTPFEELFIDEYFDNYFVASRAYREASYKMKGKYPTPKSCTANGAKYKKKLANEIEARKQALKGRKPEVIDKVLHLLCKALEYDLTGIIDVIQDEVFIKDTKDWTQTDKMLISGIKRSKNGIELELIDKKFAINMLSKIYGLDEGIITREDEGENPLTGLENIDTKTLEELYRKWDEAENNN